MAILVVNSLNFLSSPPAFTFHLYVILTTSLILQISIKIRINLLQMLTQRSQLLQTVKTHKKQYSTDSLNTQKRRKFISLVSSEALNTKPLIHHLRRPSESSKPIKQITNRAEEIRGIHRTQQGKGHTLKIKRNSAHLERAAKETKEVSQVKEVISIKEKGVGERMELFKKRLANLGDLAQSTYSKQNEKTQASTINHKALETPINRLLFESAYKEHAF